MDEIDLHILRRLSVDSRTSYSEMANDLGVAPSTIHNRIHRLEKSGAIERFTIIIDPAMINNDITTYIGINIDYEKKDEIIKKLRELNAVLELYELLEPYDLFVKVRTNTIGTLKEKILMTISGMEGVSDLSSILTTKRHKEVSTTTF
ncbi:MAG: Lrp/AsnC family transcriptional regulator [Halobacteriota archaeon]|nr:Lrp/AsnC family transcriptional regulator [Halobacteriota archaeon]